MRRTFPSQAREVYVFVKILGHFQVFQLLDPEVTAEYIRGVIERAENRDYEHANPLRG